MIKNVRSQEGFTLIEIAIVLVIIGLILGGVLKGQELIENSKVKNAVKDIEGVGAAYYSYVDRYKRLPGDDGPLATLQGRGGDWVNITAAGNNDGIIAVTAAQTFTGAGEGGGFWQHLKASGFVNGNPGDAGAVALPRNAFNGLTGFTNALVMPAGAGGLTGNKVCMSQVPGKAAAAVDAQLDDGLPNSGSLRATPGVSGANTAPGGTVAGGVYNEGAVYTICRNL
jgi:prepilin-type N-terminal cleavage/methylation domain-containing protein